MDNRIVVMAADPVVRETLIFVFGLYGLDVQAFDSPPSELVYPGLEDAACLVISDSMPDSSHRAIGR